MRVLFWNTKRNGLAPQVARIVKHQAVDLVVLAESGLSLGDLSTALAAEGESTLASPAGLCPRIVFYTRFPVTCTTVMEESDHASVRQVVLPTGESFLVAGVHLPSKLHRSDEDQAQYAQDVVQLIERAQAKAGHAKTIVIGDFNMSPDESGLVGAKAFHAVSSLKIAEKGGRTLDGRDYTFRYNPMWSLLGDASPGPPGTYYSQATGHYSLYWHMFDQVLVSPDLLPSIVLPCVTIVEAAGTESLLKNDVPHKTSLSDHLPIVFEFSPPP